MTEYLKLDPKMQSLIEGAFKLIVTIVLGLVAWIGNDISDAIERMKDQQHQDSNRLTRIESTTLTIDNGIALQKEMSKLWQELAKHPSKFPPEDHMENYYKLEERVRVLETK
jgi:hypothetical protein